jgi:hypothetical protein
MTIRDRPFNLKGEGYGFLVRSKFFFRTTQELEYLFFLSHKARNFFPEFNIRLYDKTLNQIIFFPSTKIRIFFSATLGIRIFFLEKNHTPPPPLQVKWSFPNRKWNDQSSQERENFWINKTLRPYLLQSY